MTFSWKLWLTNQDCILEDVSDEEEAPSKSKDKKANGPDSGRAPNLVFKLTSKIQYKTVLKGNFACCVIIFHLHYLIILNFSRYKFQHLFCSTQCCLSEGRKYGWQSWVVKQTEQICSAKGRSIKEWFWASHAAESFWWFSSELTLTFTFFFFLLFLFSK